MALDFELTPEQEQLKKDVAEVAAKYSYLAYGCDRDSTVPYPLFEEVGKRKWMGSFIPVKYGGMGKGAIEFSIITEELSRAGFMGFNTAAQVGVSLLVAGTEEQKQKYLPKLASGEMLTCTAISELLAGSSWDNMETTAVKREGKYVLNGIKIHINYAAEAGVLMVYAKTGKGVTIFLVDKGTPGVSFKKVDPIGLRMQPLADIYFKDCEIPESNLLSKEGHALDVFIPSFNLSRIGNASRLIGISRGALETAIDYAKDRNVGEYKVTDFQGIRWIVADLYSKIEAAALLRDKAAWLLDQGAEPALAMATAKLVAANVAEEVTSKVFSLTGGWGLYREQPFERFWRDAIVGKQGGGSTEVLKNFIARRILGKPQY